MAGIYLGLGSNIGNRESNLSCCVTQLSENSEIEIVNLSSIYETEPYGFSNQPKFLNMVVEIKTQATPVKLLNLTQHIEKKLGRKRFFHWGPRTIDIDILSYQNSVITQEKLKIPHAQMHLRKFVLVPLNEIAPDFIHPLLKKNMDFLLNECQDDTEVIKINNGKNLIS